MFGRDKQQNPDIDDVQRAIAEAATVSGVRNLSVEKDGQTFKIHGQAESLSAKQEAFRKITGALGDAGGLVNFIEVSDEKTGQVKAAGMSATAGGRTHVVKKGETLSHLALRYYGNAGLTTRSSRRTAINSMIQTRFAKG